MKKLILLSLVLIPFLAFGQQKLGTAVTAAKDTAKVKIVKYPDKTVQTTAYSTAEKAKVTHAFADSTYIDSISIIAPKLKVAIPLRSVDANGTFKTVTAGENLVFGNLVYLKSDGKFWKALGDNVATTPCIGVATASISTNSTGDILLFGVIKNTSWNWTIGGAIYLSVSTGGAMTQTKPSVAGNQLQFIGTALTATSILFNPNVIIIEL